MPSDELLDVVTRVAGWAGDGELVEAYAERASESQVVAFGGDVESVSTAESEGVGIRVVTGGRTGFAYTALLDDASLRATLDEARDNAGFGTPDEFAGVASPDGVAPADVDPWSDAVVSMSPARKVELAIELERMVRGADPRIVQVPRASYSDSRGESAVATNTGIAAASRSTGAAVQVIAVAAQEGEAQSGAGFCVRRGPDDLDLGIAADDAVRRATGLLGGTKPATQPKATVVLDPRVTASVLGVLSAALSGDAVLKQRSMFAGRIGEQVGSPEVTLVDDATDASAWGASAYDDEGLASRRTVLIDGGRLDAFLYDSYSARRAGTVSTASARRGFKTSPSPSAKAMSLAPGAIDVESLLRLVGDGVYIESVSGMHTGVNPVSGDFSVGATGWRIADGVLGAPLREFTIASTLQKMLQNVVAVGSDLEWLPGPVAGLTLAIGDVALSGS